VDTGICHTCHRPWDDGKGRGFVKRHQNTQAHIDGIKKAQQKAIELMKPNSQGYVPWTAIEVDEEEEERLSLRAALEAALEEEA